MPSGERFKCIGADALYEKLALGEPLAHGARARGGRGECSGGAVDR